MIYGVVAGILLAIPIALPPVLFVWYMNAGGFKGIIASIHLKRLAEQKIRA